MTMGAFDIVGVLILAYNLLRGLATGLIRTGVGAAAVLLATYVAWQQETWGGPLLDALLPAEAAMASVLRPVIVWIAAFLAINAFGFLLRLGVRFTPLILADRILGGIFGLLVGAGVLLLPMLFVAHFPLLQQISPIQDAYKSSWLATWFTPALQFLLEHSPALLEGQPQ